MAAAPASAQEPVLRVTLDDLAAVAATPASGSVDEDDDAPLAKSGMDRESALSIATLGTGAGLGQLLGVAVSPWQCGQERCLSLSDALFQGPSAGAGFASLFVPVLSRLVGDDAGSRDALNVAVVGALVGDGLAGLVANFGADPLASQDFTRVLGAVLASLTPVLGYEISHALHNPTVSPSVMATRDAIQLGLSGAF